MASSREPPRSGKSLFPSDPRRIGHDPDYRFSFANERTFLAWIRTALALLAGGLAVGDVLPYFPGRKALGVLLLGFGLIVAATSYRRWANNEVALRKDAPLPPSRLPMVLAIGVGLVGFAAIAILVVTR